MLGNEDEYFNLYALVQETMFSVVLGFFYVCIRGLVEWVFVVIGVVYTVLCL